MGRGDRARLVHLESLKLAGMFIDAKAFNL